MPQILGMAKGGLTCRVKQRVGLITGGGMAEGFYAAVRCYARRTLGDKTPTIISISKPMSVGAYVCVCVCVSHGTPAG